MSEKMNLFRVQKKLLGIRHAIDICEYDNNILKVKGWIFSYKYLVSNIKIVVKSGKKQYPVAISTDIKRSDVFREMPIENAKKSGFYGKILVESLATFEVWMTFDVNNRSYKFKLGAFESDEKLEENNEIKVQKISLKNVEIDLLKVINNDRNYIWTFPKEYYNERVDIIIPVYNGFEFFDRLFETISLTKMNHRLIIINDKSPDERVSPYLKQYSENHDNVILIENDNNLGFVKSVNRGLRLSENHVVLVNSDVELPEMWLERLMFPILDDDSIATATPYTNAGTIVSFPEIGEDNPLFGGMSLDDIDGEFKKVSPRYLNMPTGVGFCMAMNKRAIQEIGVLDADSFGMGYGEENDWCQRALKMNFRNVHVENLFVYHKHGGSFLSEDKKRYLKEHERILLNKHPDYNKQVARFFTVDDNKDIRRLVKYRLSRQLQSKKTLVAFDHDLGGGATSYLVKKKNEYVDEGHAFYIIKYNFVQNYYQVIYYCGKDKISFFVKKQDDIFEVLDYIKVDDIWINELVTYPNLYKFMDRLAEYSLKNHINMKMLLHDYFAICPTINLLDMKDKYCKVPKCEKCKDCFKKRNPLFAEEFKNMESWRKHWDNLLKTCKKVTVFSEDSQNILKKVYPMLNNVELVPHQIGYMPTVDRRYKTTNTLNIGLLGVLTKHKGAEIIKELCSEIEKTGLAIRIVLIGTATEKIDSPIFRETGTYIRENIPCLVLKNDIDMFLIPSIWPETFSYTTEEIMKMGMPLMCFDIGAPAERVIKYEKGIVISEISGRAVLKEIEKNDIVQNCLKSEQKKSNVLFVTEENSFASRYRVDHLREQLLQCGIMSKRIMISQASKYKLNDYDSIVIYRGSKATEIQNIVKKAHRLGKKVYYDMDDFIFEYEQIKDLKFLERKEYKSFESYSKSIKKSMALCDGYIVSTENMKKATKKSFLGKPVFINRNVASMAMLIASLGVEKKKTEKIYIGYFSGTKTHNDDFDSIKDSIIAIMKNNKNVYLLIGGQIELPEEFNDIKSRIERFEFIIWTKLPHLIAKADINLMPLEDTFFHACKSENKWMEAALVHVPTVASWNSELEGVIDNGVNGYLCKSNQEWEETLQSLIDNEQLRGEIAENAYKKVMDEYTTFSVEDDVVRALVE